MNVKSFVSVNAKSHWIRLYDLVADTFSPSRHTRKAWKGRMTVGHGSGRI